MYKNVKFNVEVIGVRGQKWKYAPEHEAMHEFAASEHSNMFFEYDNKREAKTACAWLRRNITEEKLLLEAHVIKTGVIIVKSKREAK